MSQLHKGLPFRSCLLYFLIKMKRNRREFHYKDAHFHIVSEAVQAVEESIVTERFNLESFIEKNREFQTSLVPVPIVISSLQPLSVRRMLSASGKTGLGPMAAVAGTMAQLAAEASAEAGSSETVIENGGDIYLDCREELVVGFYGGGNSRFSNLAMKISPASMPLAVCTSSGRMGHSLSFGDCDLVTVFSKDAALADSGATLGCNSVRSNEDIEPVLNKLMEIEGILGAIIIRDEQFGAVGEIPELIKTLDPDIRGKVSYDEKSSF